MVNKVADEIQKLYKLKEEGIINEIEYQEYKSKLLSGVSDYTIIDDIKHPSKRVNTIILSLLFGWIGIHRFYLGSFASGLFYLIFCWTFIPLIFSVMEFFYYIFISDDKFNFECDKTHPSYGKNSIYPMKG